MKNTLKRILLLLPVISVLLVALAVPVFADGIDGGSIEPVTFVNSVYYMDSSPSGSRSVDVTLGVPVSLENGSTYTFSHYVVFDVSSLVGSSFDLRSEAFVIRRVDQYAGTSTIFCSEVSLSEDALSVSALGFGDYGFWPLEYLDSVEILCNADLLSQLSGVNYTYYESSAFSSDSVTSVWTGIMTWIISALNSVMGAFYVDGSLTLLGTLAVIGVSVGIGFLLLGLIQRFLHLRG